jgi:hypothetical protein
MKFSSSFACRAMAIVASAVLIAFSAAAQNAELNDVLVTALGGTVNYSKSGGAYVPLPVGTHLGKGDIIKTGPSAHADLQVGNNVGVIQVTPNSTFAISELTVAQTGADTVTSSEFDLSQGAIYAKVNKLAKASRYEIKTPKGIAGIRGTTLYLTANGDLAIGEGTGGIAYFGGGAFVVHDGQMVSPGDNQPRPAPADLLKDITDSVWDAAHHGIGHEFPPFVPPAEQFVSPTLPSTAKPPRGPVSGGGETLRR